ncbi:MAG: peptidase S24 [Rikenellaceae bacterium]|nr:peptidase S24 [Rikenellaceae bacterium]
MSKILLRIQEIAVNEGITISALERKIGASKGVLSRAINHNTDIQAKWLQSLVENYPAYSEKWLLTGRGDKLKQENYRMTTRKVLRTDKTLNDQMIPLYELEATAGLVGLFVDSAVPVSYLSIPDLPPCDGAVHVRGDSMYPLLKSGDIVLYKQISNLTYGILWGEMHLISYNIDGEEYICIKYVQRSELEGHIKLVSHNKHHAPADIPLDSVRAMALVKASIRYNTMG